MAWTFRQLEASEYPKHEELVRRSPQGSLWALQGWTAYNSCDSEVWGAFKGNELVASVNIPTTNGRVLRYLPGTPWTGICARYRIEEAEGECLEVASGFARSLRAKHGEVTLTLSPEWFDIRAFIWEGYRIHPRYTYRSDVATLDYEKRVRVKDGSDTLIQNHNVAPGVVFSQRTCGFSEATFLRDWRHIYYWKANKGGAGHTELVDSAIRDSHALGLGFDLVGANSPNRGLFKRGFGQDLRVYFAVTTADDDVYPTR